MAREDLPLGSTEQAMLTRDTPNGQRANAAISSPPVPARGGVAHPPRDRLRAVDHPFEGDAAVVLAYRGPRVDHPDLPIGADAEVGVGPVERVHDRVRVFVRSPRSCRGKVKVLGPRLPRPVTSWAVWSACGIPAIEGGEVADSE